MLLLATVSFLLISRNLACAHGVLKVVFSVCVALPRGIDDRVALADAALEGIGVSGTLLDNNGLNDRIRAVAAKHRARVVEVFQQFVADPDGLIAADCVHPNDAGHAVIRDAFILAIE